MPFSTPKRFSVFIDSQVRFFEHMGGCFEDVVRNDIKILCDESEDKGLFWLTGFQSKKLIEKAGDSLAGRLCLLKLYSLSRTELLEIQPGEALDFSIDGISSRAELFPGSDLHDIFENIWRGGMPDAQALNEEQIREYFNSYIDVYLMRDAVDDNGINNTEGFRKFLRACAAFTGHLLNYNNLAAAAGISGVTSKEWIRVL